MKIAVVSIFAFPYGMASTNRIASYTKGLKELGEEPIVIMPFSTEPHDSKSTLPDKGEWQGVRFVHLQGRKRNKNRMLRALAHKTSFRFWLGAYRAWRWFKKNPVDVIMLTNDEPLFLDVYTRIANSVNAKPIFIFDEFPVPIREQNQLKIPDSKRNYFLRVLPRMAGYISINKVLAKFYNDIVVKPTLEMPIVVDTQRFDGKEQLRKNIFTYMGQILPDKDNIANIINAFYRIKDQYPDYEFHIYGKANQAIEKELRLQVKNLGLDKRVLFKGFAPADKVAQIIASSKIMVSSQPDNDRVRGVLSTKLGEYVAMGTPTLMCDVGENRSYLSDKDCYFTFPDDPKAYADTIASILDDYPKALSIARNGKETIRSKYSYIAAAKSLCDFFESLSEN